MNLNVLVVDDDAIVGFLHTIMIQRSGLSQEPLVFEHGKAALDYLNQENQQDERYLIFLDINMPVMNGWALLEAIQSSSFANRVSVIMTTSSIDIEDRIKAKSFPLVIDFLIKPLSVEILSEVNKDLLL